MANQYTHYLWYKLNGLSRYIMIHTMSNLLPLYIVNEYPKSGGSWVGEMLGETLCLPFPRNRFPLLKPSIMHGHMMHSWNMHNVLCVWRDGRDVLISQYYHWLFKNDKGNSPLVERSRSDLGFVDYNDIQNNLVPFMQYVYETKKHPRFTWADFVERWYDRNDVVHVRYEGMRSDPVDELQRIAFQLGKKELSVEEADKIVERHSFARLSGRKTGEENKASFMRKGIVGDWKNHFSQEAKEVFNQYAGDALIKIGYESDDSWVGATEANISK